jgi:hypothetical protein
MKLNMVSIEGERLVTHPINVKCNLLRGPFRRICRQITGIDKGMVKETEMEGGDTITTGCWDGIVE